MGLEVANYIADLNSSNPAAGDQKSEGDDHLRLIKLALKQTFPDLGARAWRVQSKAINYTAVAGDNMSVLAFTADATLALTAAATLGNGWMCLVVPDGAGIDVTVDPDGVETINGAATFVASKQDATLLLCDGSKFFALTVLANQAAELKVIMSSTTAEEFIYNILNQGTAETAPAIDDKVGIVDTSATAGKTLTLEVLMRVIGALTTETGIDLANDFLAFFDANVPAARKIAPASLVTALEATQANQEAGTATNRIVTPAVQHFHPSAAKYYVRFSSAGVISDDFNVTSITDNDVGDWTVNISDVFSAAGLHAPIASAQQSGGARIVTFGTIAAGSLVVKCWTDTGAAADPTAVIVAGFGDR